MNTRLRDIFSFFEVHRQASVESRVVVALRGSVAGDRPVRTLRPPLFQLRAKCSSPGSDVNSSCSTEPSTGALTKLQNAVLASGCSEPQ